MIDNRILKWIGIVGMITGAMGMYNGNWIGILTFTVSSILYIIIREN